MKNLYNRGREECERRDEMDFYEETVKSKSVFKGNVTEYVVEQVRLPNGKLAQREIVRHDKAAAIIAFTEEDKLVLVKQYRKAIEQVSVEIPAGLIDETDDNGLSAAKREFEEETGYQAKEWSPVTSYYSTPGFTDEYLEIFEAKDLSKVDSPLDQDEDETIELIEASYDEAWELYEKGELRDSKSVFALFYWKMKRLMMNKDVE